MGVQLLPWAGGWGAGVDKSQVVAFIPHPRKERLELKVVRSKDIKRLYSSPPQTQAPLLFIKHLQDALPRQGLMYPQKEVLIWIRNVALESRLSGFESQICP